MERYLTFSGRIGRPEYIICFVIPEFVILTIFGAIAETSELYSLGFVAFLFIIIPSIFGTIKRLHDIGLSGWFFLLTFLPVLGEFAWILWALLPSYDGENKYGSTSKYYFPSLQPHKI